MRRGKRSSAAAVNDFFLSLLLTQKLMTDWFHLKSERKPVDVCRLLGREREESLTLLPIPTTFHDSLPHEGRCEVRHLLLGHSILDELEGCRRIGHRKAGLAAKASRPIHTAALAQTLKQFKKKTRE
jgi:hypothetical protein